MYNETVLFINNNKHFNGPFKGAYFTDAKKLRDIYLKDIKLNIIEKMKFELSFEDIDFDEYEILRNNFINKNNSNQFNRNKKNNILDREIIKKIQLNNEKIRLKKLDIKKKKIRIITVPTHILDQSINRACSMFDSAISNMKAGNIKSFRIRCIKQSKKDKYLNLEKISFKEKVGFYISLLGYMRCKNNKLNYGKLTGDPLLRYDYGKDRFTLHVPETIKTNSERNPEQEKRYVGLDGGIRTFLTGMSNDMTVEIGNNLSKTISKDLIKLDKIKNRKDIPKKIKKKYERRINGRIQRRVTDLHWKSINYLTNTFDHIILGKLSTRSIVKNKEKNGLNKMSKRVALHMSFNKFTQRLKYKCERKKINLQIVSEHLTSKICSKCGTYNDVKKDKVYKCRSCGLKIDRDINAAKNIAMRGLLIKKE